MKNYKIDQEIEATKALPENKGAAIDSIINTVADKLAIPCWIVRAVNHIRRDNPEMLLPDVDPLDPRFKLKLPLIKVPGAGDAQTYYNTLLEVHEACVDIVKYFQSHGYEFWDGLVTATVCIGLGSLRNTVAVMAAGNLGKEVLDISSDQCDPYTMLEQYIKARGPKLNIPYSLCERYDARYGADMLELEFKNRDMALPDYLTPLLQQLRDAVANYDSEGGDWLSWQQPQSLWYKIIDTLGYDRHIWFEEGDRYDRPTPGSANIFGRLERGTFFANGPSTIFIPKLVSFTK